MENRENYIGKMETITSVGVSLLHQSSTPTKKTSDLIKNKPRLDNDDKILLTELRYEITNNLRKGDSHGVTDRWTENRQRIDLMTERQTENRQKGELMIVSETD